MKHKTICPTEKKWFTKFFRGYMLKEICRMFAQNLVYRAKKHSKHK